MSDRIIINDDGWYLFGIRDGEKITTNVKSGDARSDNFLNDHIVVNHSANVETAYVVDKHKTLRAWILKKDGGGFKATTNMAGVVTGQWFKNDDSIISNEKDLTTAPTDGKKIVLRNDNGEKVVGVYSDVIIMATSNLGIPLSTATSAQKKEISWAFEPNTVLTAVVNKTTTGALSYSWMVDGDQLDDKSVAYGTQATFTISGPIIGKTISCTVSEDTVSIGTATYNDYIGPSVDPFVKENWRKVIYPAPSESAINSSNINERYEGVSEWTNNTDITLGIWVHIVNFADTVPPKLAQISGSAPTSNDNLVGEVRVADGTDGKQVITIPFSKELVIPTKTDDSGLYVDPNDFTIESGNPGFV